MQLFKSKLDKFNKNSAPQLCHQKLDSHVWLSVNIGQFHVTGGT
jgi:hypothetical protein